MSRILITSLFFFALLCLSLQNEDDQGLRRLKDLRERSSESKKHIIQFSKRDFDEYAMTYPRPYDLVIYFTANSCSFCVDLLPQFEYTVELYKKFGAIDTDINPTFFAKITYTTEFQSIFQDFGFNTAPNLVVSKPHMSVVSDSQRKAYYQKFKWSISHTDGHVTTHKMLEFVNKRTDKDVMYRPTFLTMIQTFFGFILISAIGVVAYIKLKFLWTNWIVWFIGSIAIYITCCSGVVFNILHDVPMVGRDQKTGETTIFSDGSREQYGLQGLIISLSITFIALLFVSIVQSSQLYSHRYSFIIGLVSLLAIYWIVYQMETVYKAKSWYGPNFHPPNDYISGPLARDQGNNI